jgi:hypothetical protein
VVRTHVVWFHRVRAYDDHSHTETIEQRLICGQRMPDRRLNSYSTMASLPRPRAREASRGARSWCTGPRWCCSC